MYIVLIQTNDHFVEKWQKHLQQEVNWQVDIVLIQDLIHCIGRYDAVLIPSGLQKMEAQLVDLQLQYPEIYFYWMKSQEYVQLQVENIKAQLQHETLGIQKGKNMSTKQKVSFMDKLTAWMEKYVVPVGTKIASQRHLASVRDGLTVLIPATIVGGFAILIAVPPVPASITEPSNFFYAMLLAWKAFATAHNATLMLPYTLTIGMIAVYVVCGVAYQHATSYKMNGINNMISALLVFLCVSGALAEGKLTVGRLGASYMFAAMLIGLFVVDINHFFAKNNITIKMPDSVPPNVSAPFNVLIPLIFNVVFFIALDKVIMMVANVGFADLIYAIFQPLMKATNSLPSILLFSFLASLFWFFGIHGNNMVSAIVTPITTAALAANAEAIVAHKALPYIWAGGMGSVFGGWLSTNNAMVLVLILFCHSSRIKNLMKVSAIPAMFNIAEPNIFGLPTVLNVYTFIPGIINVSINTIVYYVLASMNVVGRFYVSLPFTTPAILQGFLATGDIKVALLLIVLLPINMLVWYPFLKAYDKQLLLEEANRS